MTEGGGIGRAAAAVCVADWTISDAVVATDVEVVVLDCVTAPLSPGLNTRTDTAVFVPGAGASGVSSQPQRQSQTQVVPGWSEGVTELVSTEESPQFQIQVHTQVNPGSVGGCTDALSAETDESSPLGDFELVPPVFGC
jgi:hypothetical protein